ncbi:class II aldolase/adducin family protein [Candidatus Bathyarchaeota archaeon]|nr:MAG: class II aldolase/adducin family protein [Candidatus Bathyarchaeota archaeon]
MFDEEERLKRKIVEISRRLYEKGFMEGTGGNVSAKLPNSQIILTTPSGVCKGYLSSSDIVKIDYEGKIVEGKLKPTSETPMHTSIYKARPDINAVIHAHPPFCTGFACAGMPIDSSIFPEAIVMVGEVALVEYATPGTDDLAMKVSEAAKMHDALLLQNHGTVTLGASLEEAYLKTEVLEETAHILLISTLLGGYKSLPEAEVKKIKLMVGRK